MLEKSPTSHKQVIRHGLIDTQAKTIVDSYAYQQNKIHMHTNALVLVESNEQKYNNNKILNIQLYKNQKYWKNENKYIYKIK